MQIRMPKIDERVMGPSLVMLVGPLAVLMFVVLFIVFSAKFRLKRLWLQRAEGQRNADEND